jgi:hypothetical protein
MATVINGTTGIDKVQDGTITADDIVSGVIPTGFGFKNRLINGAMMIDQRNAGASVTPTNGTYTLDRWRFGVSFDGTVTAQQSSVAPAGFNNSLLLTVSSPDTSLGASQFFGFRQRIEGFNVADLGFGTANASTVTLSFWVRSSVTGTFSAAITNSADNRLYPASYTINSADTWEQKVITVAGDTTGTWLVNNGVGLQCQFYLALGSNFLGTANAWTSSAIYGPTGMTNFTGTNGATFYITGVQLEKGSTATSFDYRPYGTELALCQRYYQIVALNIYNGNPGASEYHSVPVPYLAQMRATPTAGTISGGTSTNIAFTGIESLSAYGCRFTIQSSASSDSGYVGGQCPLTAEL